MRQELIFQRVIISFRQGLFFSILIDGFLALQHLKLLTWYNAAFLILGLTIAEFFYDFKENRAVSHVKIHDSGRNRRGTKNRRKSIQNQQSLEALERTESDLFGRKGSFTALFKRISEVPVSQRASIGSALNSAKITLEAAIELKKKSFSGKEGSRSTDIDMTLPGIRPPRGSLHPMTSAIEEIEKIFTALEFVRRRYNEVEWDYYAFEALNMPEDHPLATSGRRFYFGKTRRTSGENAPDAAYLIGTGARDARCGCRRAFGSDA